MIWTALQHILPHHAISRGVGWLARRRSGWFKNLLNRVFVRAFALDMSEAANENPLAYDSFNALFTRALKPGARPLDGDADSIVSPVDATVSECGRLAGNQLVQAKGRSYTLEALLGGDADGAARYRDGAFATLYLSPRDYHRIHMPLAGTVQHMTLIRGRLFSVNAATAASVDNLFARNERVICEFEERDRRFAMVLVGALNVGSMATVWHGDIRPPRGRRQQRWDYGNGATLARGAEMGRFNLGSTVILLLPPGAAQLNAALAPGCSVRMGTRIGTWPAAVVSSGP